MKNKRDRHASSSNAQTRESSPKDLDEDQPQVVKEDEWQPRSSSTAIRRRDSDCRRDADDSAATAAAITETKRMRLDDEAAPRLRLNASLATDPALRPAAVAALTVKPGNTSPLTPPPLPAGLQNGKQTGRGIMKNFILY